MDERRAKTSYRDAYSYLKMSIFVFQKYKSIRTTMRPLGIYLIGISMYILNMIHFMTILGDFGVFSLMLTDRTTDGRTDRASYRDARTHLITGPSDGLTERQTSYRDAW